MTRRVALIDNYDSFTYNLLHYVQELGAEVSVFRNDAITVSELSQQGFDGVILSPGPGSPADSGVCRDIVSTLGATLPIFGVCLGHQVIGEIYGGSIIRNKPMHGKVSAITHDATGVFAGLPSPMNVTRYHSLVIDPDTVPDVLHVTAQTADGVIMGVSHKTHPVHGVQFHPESIASEHGHHQLKNFLDMMEQ